jgi:tripartite-type tricarboxylate transporter receptor subunit TctC
VLRLPTYRAKLAELGLEPFELSPDEATTFIARELDKWTQLVAAASIQAE